MDHDGWASGVGSTYSLQKHHGTTPSASTGPSGGPSGATYYYYAEASSPRVSGDRFTLSYSGSHCGALNVASINFHYHMYGAAMGVLKVLNSHGGAVWSKSGNQGDHWEKATATINSPGFTFDFTMGSNEPSFENDAAVALVTVNCAQPGDASVPQVLPPSPPPPPLKGCYKGYKSNTGINYICPTGYRGAGYNLFSVDEDDTEFAKATIYIGDRRTSPYEVCDEKGDECQGVEFFIGDGGNVMKAYFLGKGYGTPRHYDHEYDRPAYLRMKTPSRYDGYCGWPGEQAIPK
jgi:hypothetical protein